MRKLNISALCSCLLLLFVSVAYSANNSGFVLSPTVGLVQYMDNKQPFMDRKLTKATIAVQIFNKYHVSVSVGGQCQQTKDGKGSTEVSYDLTHLLGKTMAGVIKSSSAKFYYDSMRECSVGLSISFFDFLK